MNQEEKVPPQTSLTKDSAQREKLLGLIKKYEVGELGTYEDIARGMRSSLRTIKRSITRLKYEEAYGEAEEEAREEIAKKYTHFAIRTDRARYMSPIPEVQRWIEHILYRLRPATRQRYIGATSECWRYIIQKHGLYNPMTWSRSEVDDFIDSLQVRRRKAVTQNSIRSSVNSLMKALGMRHIFYGKLQLEAPEPIALSVDKRAKWFEALKIEYPQKWPIYRFLSIFLLKTGSRIGNDWGRDPDNPSNDRGALCVRTRAIFLHEKPVRITVRDKGKGEKGQVWTKFLDSEGEKELRSYLAWREENRPGWADLPWLFGTTTYQECLKVMQRIRRKYNLFEIDKFGNKRWLRWHMFRDCAANDLLLAFSEGDPEKADRGFLAVAELLGWKDLGTLKKHYITAATMNKLRRAWLPRLEGAIKTGLEEVEERE